MTTYEAHITFPNRLRRKVKRNAGIPPLRVKIEEELYDRKID